jgi:hypothetical protein
MKAHRYAAHVMRGWPTTPIRDFLVVSLATQQFNDVVTGQTQDAAEGALKFRLIHRGLFGGSFESVLEIEVRGRGLSLANRLGTSRPQ